MKKKGKGKPAGRVEAVRSLAFDAIRLDGETQARAAMDDKVIAAYERAYRRGHDIPPVVVFVDGTNVWLAAGYHRFHAAKRAGLNALPALVRNGTVEDARWFAAGSNKENGSRPSAEDDRKSVQMALAHPDGAGMSSRKIANHVGVSHTLVDEVRGNPMTPRQGVSGSGCHSQPDSGGDKMPAKVMRVCPKCKTDASVQDGVCLRCQEAPEIDAEPDTASGRPEDLAGQGNLFADAEPVAVEEPDDETMTARDGQLERLAMMALGFYDDAAPLLTRDLDKENLRVTLDAVAIILRRAKGQ